MGCKICGKKESEDICVKCFHVINIDNNLKHISNEFYNRGLRKSQNRDISGAIKELEKSIAYDSANYYARNLIGLCYYEIGMYGEASKNWFLSRYNEFDDNNVQKYIDEIGVELSENKELVTSIELYNEALIKIQNKEIAGAHQLLTEAIEKNERLVPAYNLLILVNLIQGQKDSAIPLIDKVLSIDCKNQKALYYYAYATQNKFRPTQNTMNRLPIVQEKETIQVLDRKKLIIGCCLSAVAALVFTCVVFSVWGKGDNAYDELNTKYQETLQTSKNNADAYTAAVDEKQTEINTLTTEKIELENQVNIYKNAQYLAEAKLLYDDGNYIESAAKLYSTDIENISDSQQKVYNDIYSDVYSKAIELLHTSGIEKFNNGDFSNSKSDLQTAYLYCGKVDVSDKIKAEIIYYLARDFEELQDLIQAKEYYGILTQDYPDYAKDSSDRLATMAE